MGRKRKTLPPPDKDNKAPDPSSTTTPPPSPSEPPKKRGRKPKAANRPPPEKSKSQKRPKRAIRQQIVLEMKDLKTQLGDEIQRNKEQLRRFGDALELALREFDDLRGITWVQGVERNAEAV